ncbi:hypothetical protein DL98DRAFT_428900 [Cadophora sp. DSE1049]|nr:hypothetical protein DL98DRAFT_428900 [Cadophora sp. DSE1049]
MSTGHRSFVPRKACTRCSTQKRRCDKAVPQCGNCSRLHQECKYELPDGSLLSPSPSSPPRSEFLFSLSQANTPTHLRDTVIARLDKLTPDNIFSTYARAIDPWFPVVSISGLRTRSPTTWEEAPFDVVLLCLSINLFATNPPTSSDTDVDASDFKSLYLYTKSVLASTEALGVNSVLVVQSRLLVTLFEIGHGFYPAAYISIGTTVRAAEALEAYPDTIASTSLLADDQMRQEELGSTWRGIQALDRYVAVESGPYPTITGARTQFFHGLLKPTACMSQRHEENRTNPASTLARFSESSYLLDNVYTALHSPTYEEGFNIEEITLTVQTLSNLQTILIEETGDKLPLYNVGLSLCNIALLLAFENGSKMAPTASSIENVNYVATQALVSTLSAVASAVEPFTNGTQSVDFELLPPFIIFLVYKAAAIVTERLLMGSDSTEDELKRLRALRKFLRVVGERWLGCKRYLDFLNEDTTPRILKAIEQG